MLPALPGVVVDGLDVDLDAEGDLDLSNIPPSSVTYFRSSLQGDFSFIQEKHDKCSINRPPNGGNVFRLVLGWLNTLDEQRPLLSCVD